MENYDEQIRQTIKDMISLNIVWTKGKNELEELLNRQYRRYRMRMQYLKRRLRWK